MHMASALSATGAEGTAVIVRAETTELGREPIVRGRAMGEAAGADSHRVRWPKEVVDGEWGLEDFAASLEAMDIGREGPPALGGEDEEALIACRGVALES